MWAQCRLPPDSGDAVQVSGALCVCGSAFPGVLPNGVRYEHEDRMHSYFRFVYFSVTCITEFGKIPEFP